MAITQTYSTELIDCSLPPRVMSIMLLGQNSKTKISFKLLPHIATSTGIISEAREEYINNTLKLYPYLLLLFIVTFFVMDFCGSNLIKSIY